MDSKWSVYILRCGDGTLYTGVAKDVHMRLETHRSGKGAKYTRARLPVTLVYYEEFETSRQAQSREAKIKRLTRQQKLELIAKQKASLA